MQYARFNSHKGSTMLKFLSSLTRLLLVMGILLHPCYVNAMLRSGIDKDMLTTIQQLQSKWEAFAREVRASGITTYQDVSIENNNPYLSNGDTRRTYFSKLEDTAFHVLPTASAGVRFDDDVSFQLKAIKEDLGALLDLINYGDYKKSMIVDMPTVKTATEVLNALLAILRDNRGVCANIGTFRQQLNLNLNENHFALIESCINGCYRSSALVPGTFREPDKNYRHKNAPEDMPPPEEAPCCTCNTQ